MDTLFSDAVLVTCDADDRVLPGWLHMRADHIVALGAGDPPDVPGARSVALGGRWLLPGFVQTHIHLVQTLFRGLADDLALLDWLAERVWPLERAHDADSTYWSARLGITELLLGGTTSILDMATVDHTDGVFHAAREGGLRATVGKAMMDLGNPAGLSESTDAALRSSMDLRDRWHRKGRLRYAFAPRFVPSCSERLLRETAREARRTGCIVHTHASENLDEVELVRSLTGRENVAWLDELGISGSDVVLAHCIHLSQEEVGLLLDRGTVVAHCPSSNLKLGSGIARIPELLDAGVHVTLGADGAPCNNRLDIFAEMRLAALIQKPRLGPTTMPATAVLRLATTEGARALGIPAGALTPGSLADLVVVDPDAVHGWGGGDPHGALVYAMTPAAVRDVWVGGEQVVADRAVVAWDVEQTLDGCRTALRRVRERVAL